MVLKQRERSSELIETIRFGRDNFDEATKVANRMPLEAIDWSKFKYMAFDAPAIKDTYEERYRSIGKGYPAPSFSSLFNPIKSFYLNRGTLACTPL